MLRHLPACGLLLLMVLGLLLGPHVEAEESRLLAPDWTLEKVGGGSVSLHRDARGVPAVLFFWASWCPHCGAALPVMESLYQEFAPRGVRFYALNIWEDGDAVGYFRAHGYHLPLFLTADLVAEEYGIKGTPGVVVIDRQMGIKELHVDGVSPREMADVLRQYLRAELNRDIVTQR